MKKKLIGIGALVLVLALLLTLVPACGNGDEEPTPVGRTPTPGVTPQPGVTPTPTGEVKTLKIGLVFPLSGPAAAYGIDHELGAKWAADKFNQEGGLKVGNDRYMIEIVSCDDKYTGSGAADCATRFVYEEGIRFVLGPIAGVGAVDPIFEQNKVLYIVGTVSADPSPATPYMVNGITTTKAWLEALVGQAIEHHPEIQTVVSLSPEYDIGHSFKAAADEVMPKLGLTLLANELFDITATDLYPVLAPVVAMNPDLIETGASPPGTQALILKQARELGYEGWIMGTSAGPTDVLISIAGPENMWKVFTSYPGWHSEAFPQRTRDLYQEWLDNYAAPGQTEMGITVSNSWKFMTFLRDAIEEAGSIDPEDILPVIDDPSFRFDVFAADNQRLGGIETFGIRRCFPHPIPYGEILSADDVRLSISFRFAEVP
jgi:branched-chain amino acid transport system substrate-binding protein